MTTSFLDKVPEEIVERILKFHVEDVGAVPAWKNLLVCRKYELKNACVHFNSGKDQFARIIKHEVLARQPIQAFKRLALKGGPGRIIIKNNISLYLQLRVTALYGAEPYMPGYVAEVVHIISRGATDSDEALKAAHVKILCDVIAKHCRCAVSLMSMDHLSQSARAHIQYWSDTTTGNKTAAAAALGNMQALDEYCKTHPYTLWKESPAFGYPLAAATCSGQTRVVAAIIKEFENVRQNITDDHRSATLVAMARALETNDEELTLVLVQFYAKWFRLINTKAFRNILYTAIRSGNTDIVMMILGLKHHGGKDLYAQGYSLACRLGHIRVAGLFLENNLLAVDKSVGRHGCPLEMAVRSGNVEAVKELLDIGVDVNGTFLPGNPSHDSALHHAASAKDVDMVRMLLKAGASPYLAGAYGQDSGRSDRSFWEIDQIIDEAVYNQVHGSSNE